MAKQSKYVPKHRAPIPASETPKKALRNTVILSSVAAVATGAAVSSGVLNSSNAGVDIVAANAPSADRKDGTADQAATSKSSQGASSDASESSSEGERLAEERVADRGEDTSSRSDLRAAADPAKQANLSVEEGGAVTLTEDVTDDDPRSIAKAMLSDYGWGSDQFSCLDNLWTKESGWRVDADNPTSSAYGIPQSLPGSKMASAGSDWETNPATQIEWGLGYIQDRYGTPCSAWGHSVANNWY